MSHTDKTLAQEFFSDFQAARTELVGRVDTIKSNGTSSADLINALSLDVAKLRKRFTDATAFLPPYDQRQYENFLKSMEQSLGELQAGSGVKPKFTFKRKPNKVSVPVTSTALNHPGQAQVLPPKEVQETGLDSSHLSLSGHSRQYLTWSLLPPVSSQATDITISNLDQCVVNLLPDASSASQHAISALHIRNLVNTVVILPPIQGSALIHDLTNCTIALGCHQFRMHTSSNVNVYLSIRSNPIIEHCSSVAFASYPSSLLPSGSENTTWFDSRHLSVQDFSHIRPTPSPNWSALSAEMSLSLDDWTSVANGRSDTVVAMLARTLPDGTQIPSA